MNLILALAVGIVFASGAFLMLKPDLLRVAAGLVLVSNAAVLTLLASGVSRGRAPILPVPDGADVSDPLVQALAVTALVIGFAVVALLLALVERVHASHDSVDLDELSRAEVAREEELEREEVSV